MSAATPKQLAARIQNNKIRMLRGLWGAVKYTLDVDLQDGLLHAIDQQLVRLGAQPETERRKQDHEAMLQDCYYKGYGKRRKLVSNK